MASLDSLPADQRAVLQLVLQRGRTYEQIAGLLSIDPGAVRQRAVSALETLGPETPIAPERRAVITDYLLGQLAGPAADHAREEIAGSAGERAWARVVASELGTLASGPLPEIPLEAGRRTPEPAAVPVAAEPDPYKPEPYDPEPQELARSERSKPEGDTPDPAASGGREPAETAPARESRRTRPRPAVARRSSRLGGAVVLAGIAVVVIVVAIVLIAGGGGGGSKTTSTTASTPTSTAGATTSTTAATSTGGTSTTGASPQVIRQINLSPPIASSKTKGLADVLRQGSTDGVAIIAQAVPANTRHDAYAVWLYNSPSDSHILGFVNPGVGSNGRLSTAGPLPSNASHYKQLIVTLETQSNPTAPGKIILQGPLGF